MLTQYFYEQLLQFEKSPTSLKESMGELVYGMDVDQQVHRAKQIEFDKEADEDVLQRTKAAAAGGTGPGRGAAVDRRHSRGQRDGAEGAIRGNGHRTSVADAARAHFILARADLMSVHAGESEDDAERTIGESVAQFEKTLETSKDQRLAGVVAHLSGPHSGYGMQAGPGGDGVSRRRSKYAMAGWTRGWAC